MSANLNLADLHFGKKIGCSIHYDSHSAKKIKATILIPYYIVELSRFKDLTPNGLEKKS